MDNEKPLTLAEAQARVDEWIKTYGVRYFSELTNMACLTEEVGELARVMARRYGDPPRTNNEAGGTKHEKKADSPGFERSDDLLPEHLRPGGPHPR